MDNMNKIRFGLVQIFKDQNIIFVHEEVKVLKRLPRQQQLKNINEYILQNANSLLQALQYCKDNRIGAFQVTNRIWPHKAHPLLKYNLSELQSHEIILKKFEEIGHFATQNNIMLTLHATQFIILNSPIEAVYQHAIEELQYLNQIADLLQIKVISLRAGRSYGDKIKAIQDLKRAILKLPIEIKQKLALENDDKVFTPQDLIPICQELDIPLQYDVHHHRCAKDILSIEQATQQCIKSFKKVEPIFILSSPQQSWKVSSYNYQIHHDFINPDDFPREWLHLDISNFTIFIDSRSKETAIFNLRDYLEKNDISLITPLYSEQTQIHQHYNDEKNKQKEFQMMEQENCQQIEDQEHKLSQNIKSKLRSQNYKIKQQIEEEQQQEKIQKVDLSQQKNNQKDQKICFKQTTRDVSNLLKQQSQTLKRKKYQVAENQSFNNFEIISKKHISEGISSSYKIEKFYSNQEFGRSLIVIQLQPQIIQPINKRFSISTLYGESQDNTVLNQERISNYSETCENKQQQKQQTSSSQIQQKTRVSI